MIRKRAKWLICLSGLLIFMLGIAFTITRVVRTDGRPPPPILYEFAGVSAGGGVAFSPDSRWFTTIDSRSIILVEIARGWQSFRRVPNTSSSWTVLAFSPDSRSLI